MQLFQPGVQETGMAPNVEFPAQSQVGLRGVLGNGKNKSRGFCSRPLGRRRRIFVQTDTGSVLGIELDRTDNAQTVKKKMQSVLNVPPEQTALVFGDVVVKNDLSNLRDHSPILLTRDMNRSFSTPCIFPPVSDKPVQEDGGQPFEVVGNLKCQPEIKCMVEEILEAVESGVEPVVASGGLGGAYFFRNVRGENVAIVKPTDEEPLAPNNPKGFVGKSLGLPGLKRTVRVGETGVREVAAYLLDHDHFAKVPPTALVKVSHHALNVNGMTSVHKRTEKGCCSVAKLASFQQFVPHDFDASDHGTSHFSVSAVHRIGILDVRLYNTDRHGGNILIRNMNPPSIHGNHTVSNVCLNDMLELIPIDHGLCLPEALEDPYFEWLHWPQSSLPFSEEELDYIRKLNENKDVETLRQELPMLREACFRILLLSTTLLKRAAEAGLCLAEIGEMMSRDRMDGASELELLCVESRLQAQRDCLAERLCEGPSNEVTSGSSPSQDVHEQFEFEMEGRNLDNKCLTSTLYDVLDVPNSPPPLTELDFPDVIHGDSSQKSSSEVDGLNIQACSLTDTSSSNGILASKTILPSHSDKRAFGNRSLKKFVDHGPKFKSSIFCPLAEEEEITFAPVAIQASPIAASTIKLPRPRKSANNTVCSSNTWKQRWIVDSRGAASEKVGKADARGGSPSFTVGDLNEEEWLCFIKCFERVLQEALTERVNQSMIHRNRLGISCQF